MRIVRNRSANWLRQELARGIGDYLDECEDVVDGRRKLVFVGPGGYRSRLNLSFGVQQVSASVRDRHQSSDISLRRRP